MIMIIIIKRIIQSYHLLGQYDHHLEFDESLHGSLVETHPAPATTAGAVNGSTFHTTAETALPNLKDNKTQITILLCQPQAFDKF